MNKTSKLLDRLVELLSSKKRKQAAEIDTLKELLDKLKKRQRKMEQQLEQATGSKEKQLRRDIKVIKAQRKKGLARYRKLVDAKDS